MMGISSNPLTETERMTLIREILEARREIDAAGWELERSDGPSGDERDAANNRYERALDRLREVELPYEARLPRPAISRCPFTGNLVEYHLDTFGLDGPWWDAEQPVRPIVELPPTVFAITGAVAILGKAPETPFSVKPGPGVPWVVPRILSLPGIRAVVSCLKIGPYLAYPVVYFSIDSHREHPRINTWGTDRYMHTHEGGSGSIERTWNLPGEFDYDLKPWIQKGKVLWISPEDPESKLRSLPRECPYLDLEGYRYPVLLRGGALKSCLLEMPDDVEQRAKGL